MIQVLTFRLHKPTFPFNIDDHNSGDSYKLNPFIVGMFDTTLLLHPDLTTSSKELSEQFNNLVNNNQMLLLALNAECDWKDESDLFSFSEIKEFGTPEVIRYGLSSDVSKDRVCHILKQRFRSYGEVMTRDEDALNVAVNKVKLYVTIVSKDNVYQGHIYTWISNLDQSYCFSMGIRNRIDAVVLKELDSDELLHDVSYYLLEGIRRFALSKDCTEVYIATPTKIMIPILEKLQFVGYTVDFKLAEGGLAKHSSTKTILAYRLIDPSFQIMVNDLLYSLID